MNAFDSTLSLCMRARRLVYGFETVKHSVQSGAAVLLLTASDVSAKTCKEVDFLSRTHHVPHLTLSTSMEELSHIIGKKTGVISITDEGFGKKLMLIRQETEDNLCR